MNQHPFLEDRLQALGTALQARPRLSERVMEEIRKLADDRSAEESPRPMALGNRRRWLAATVGVVATTGVGLLIALTLFRSPSVSWAEVTQAVQSQNWIRGTFTAPNRGQFTMWLSPRRQIWAFSDSHYVQFCDGVSHTKYERHGIYEPIIKLPLGDVDTEKILPIEALSQDKDVISPWVFGMDKVVAQTRTEITEDGQPWIEFHLVLSRLKNNRATLRVDPKTKLPVELRFDLATDPAKPHRWDFDYPADGPTDIYALGVPRDISIDDQMPSANAQKVLDAMAASRAKIGDFRLIVSEEPATSELGIIVWRKGNRWREDRCFPLENVDPPVQPPQGKVQSPWFEEVLNRSLWIPLHVCDGQTVWLNDQCLPGKTPHWKTGRTAPQDLMSADVTGNLGRIGIASLLYPDLTPKFGDKFEFDPKPLDAPGCVMLELSAEDASGQIGHARYYVDPAKGYAVVRVELYRLPLNVPNDAKHSKNVETSRMEDFQHPTPNIWYPAVVHEETVDIDPQGKPKHDSTTTRYHIDFDAELPDSLFKLDEAQKPQ